MGQVYSIEIFQNEKAEEKEPVIGNELAEFWEQLIIETYNSLNENERQSLCL